MKIAAIKTSNFLGARAVDLHLSRPVTLICGKNHSGKSSIVEGVRMALTGEPSRVSLKKEYSALVSDGAQVGYAVVEYDGQRSAITIPNGAHEHTDTGGRPTAMISYVLDAQRFSSLSPNDRRVFLFDLMGLRTDGASVSGRLLDKGCDPIKKDEIIPFLRAGFDAAHKEAQSKAREAKAAWRTVAGEAYGSIKAASWKAPKPDTDANKLRQARGEVERLAALIEECASSIAVMRTEHDRQAKEASAIAGLRARASQFARIDAKLRKDEYELKEWQAKVEIEEQNPAKKTALGATFDCPQCAAKLRHDNGRVVVVTDQQEPEHREPSRLPEYRSARDLLARSVENDRRDLAISESAAKQIAEVDGEKSAPAPTTEEIETACKALTDLRNQKTRAAADLKVLEESERLAAQADKRTEAAAIHHADVAQWEAIADALAPNGIPGEMLAEALAPINARLASSAHMAEWAPAAIGPDMGITAGGRPYSLLSESEKWRADAMLAEAVSHLSGVKLLVLDRFDLLDLTGREDLLYWLDGLAEDGEIDTALLFGTLKAIPSSVPDTVGAFWIENGTAGKVQEAA